MRDQLPGKLSTKKAQQSRAPVCTYAPRSEMADRASPDLTGLQRAVMPRGVIERSTVGARARNGARTDMRPTAWGSQSLPGLTEVRG